MKMKNISIVILCITLLSGCRSILWKTADVKYHRYEIGEAEGSDSAMQDMIAPYKNELDAKMDVVIGDCVAEMTKERVESSLGNWMADIVLEEAQRLTTDPVDFAALNYGGIRSNDMAAGPITVRKIFEIMPFENEIVIIAAKGKYVMQFLDRIADYGGWPVSKGISLVIVEGRAVNVLIQGSPVDGEKIYRFAIPDYIANGGDNVNFLKDAERFDFDILIRDAMIQHIKRDTEMGVKQFGEKEGRITKQ